MRFRYSRNFTVRYSASHDAKTFHGIGTKDCFPKSSTPDAQECCTAAASNVSPGALWTNNYAIYSNRFYRNGEYGLDSHSSDGEIAGNMMENNRYGTKFPDASICGFTTTALSTMNGAAIFTPRWILPHAYRTAWSFIIMRSAATVAIPGMMRAFQPTMCI
ncbi:MAG: hypothetical protein R2911_43360 [Caldilineaceae bacterium]